ncbi:MAG: MBL fold metallo-hydrolase [Clostridia bacterium]|nr:MBL fold metallo-hydrolase [Clostridia bacterium]
MKDFDKVIKRVTGGKGGESFLILGSEKTAVIDTGAAYCASALIENIERELGGRTLDYIFITHSHFDHVGAVASLKAHWPGVKVLGGTHAANILSRPNARKLIRQLAEGAKQLFDPKGEFPPVDYDNDLLVCDIPLKEGDRVSLGDITVRVLDAPGHTRCSVAFYLEELDINFMSESVGVVLKSGDHFPSYVTSYSDAIDTIEKFRKLNARYFVVPHSTDIMDLTEMPGFFDTAVRVADELKDKILRYHDSGMDNDAITDAIVDEVQPILLKNNQTREAFALNMTNTVKTVVRDFRPEDAAK